MRLCLHWLALNLLQNLYFDASNLTYFSTFQNVSTAKLLCRSVSAVTLILACFASGAVGTAKAETFQEALISAYQTNPRLKAERARVKEADENYIQARAQGRLNSSLSGSIGGQAVRAPEQSFFGNSGGRSIDEGYPRVTQLQVIQPIYQGGRVRALKSQANFNILAARQGLKNAEQNLMLSAATAYVDVLRDEETARIRRNNVSVLARQEQAARDRFDVGEGTLTDIAQSQSRLAAANIGLAQADAQLATSRATYERAIGHPPVDLQPVPEFILPSTVYKAQRIGLDNNPQLLAARLNKEAALAGRDVAAAAGKPSFSINASLVNQRAQIGFIREADTASLTAQLNIPLYSGGANKSRVRQAMNTVERLAYEAVDVENTVKQSVSQIWAQLIAARRSLKASETQVEAAEVAFEGVTLEQQVGTRDTLDVLNAEQELLNAKLSVVNAQRTVNATVYQLLSVLGVFDADSINLPVDYYDPKDNLENIKNDGLSRAVKRYMPVAAQKIGRQLPNIPRDIVGFAGDSSLVHEIENVGDNSLKLLDGAGLLTKQTIDFVTGQSGEAARITADENSDSEVFDQAPIVLVKPDWKVPPTIESSGN